MTEQNIEVTPEPNDNPVVIVPNIEEDVILPKNSKDALPEMSVNDELNARANTIKVLSDIKGETLSPSYTDIKDAEDLAKEMMKNPKLKPEFGNYPNETMAYLAGLVASTQCMIVEDLADFKLYVLNNLVKVAESTDNPKEKIAALRSIGEIDGVDAFKRKTEVTHKVESMEEVEKELLSMLAELKEKALIKEMPQTVDAEIIEDKDGDTETDS